LVTSIPRCAVSEMIGFLEILNDYNGAEDIARLAGDYGMEIDEILPAVEMAEALKFVTISEGNVYLTDYGKKFIKTNIEERKDLIRQSLSEMLVFKMVMNTINKAPDRRIASSDLIPILQLVSKHPEKHLRTIINWGRYAQLFKYESTTDEIIGI